MKDKKLTKKETDFCIWYAKLQNSREAAIKSGYDVLPEYRGVHLLGRRNIQNKIKELTEQNKTDDNLIFTGFRRLAFGSVADAVKLILSCNNNEEIPDIDSLDLFSVSEIKYTCGKGMEIKFFDRLKALDALQTLSSKSENNSALNFYEALERSAKAKEVPYGDC